MPDPSTTAQRPNKPSTADDSDFALVDGRVGGVLHRNFKPAAFRGVTNTNGKIIGVSFDLPDGSIARFALHLPDAISLAGGVLDYAGLFCVRMNSQSPSSSGNPSVDVSTQRE